MILKFKIPDESETDLETTVRSHKSDQKESDRTQVLLAFYYDKKPNF